MLLNLVQPFLRAEVSLEFAEISIRLDVKGLKTLGFCRCNEGTIVDGALNNPNPNDSHVIETISVYKFQQVLGSLQPARKVALDQVAYENEARSLKSLKILGLGRNNEGTIVTKL